MTTSGIDSEYRCALFERDRVRRLLGCCSNVVSIGDLDEIANESLRGMPRFLDCAGGGVILLSPDGAEVKLFKATGSLASIPQTSIENALRNGSFMEVENHGYSFHAGEFLTGDGLSRGLVGNVVAAAARASRLAGFVLVAGPAGSDRFSEDDLELILTLGRAIAVSADNSHLVRAALDNEQRMRELLWRLVDIEENERRRVAGEIHDWMSSQFFDFYYGLRDLQDLHAQGDPGVADRLVKLTAAARHCADDMRHFMNRLHPTVIDDFGFVTVLKEHVAALQQHADFTIQLTAPDEDCPKLSRDVNMTLLRVLEEAMVNVRTHAAARSVAICFQLDCGKAVLTIRDDGRGFDPNVFSHGHFGIYYMHERVKACGGEMTLRSSPGHGTELEARLPI